MYIIHGTSHTWEGLEACIHGSSGLHGLKYGQLKPCNCGEQTRPNPMPERAESSQISFTMYGHRLQVVWCTAFPLHVVACMQYVWQGLSTDAVCSTFSVWGNHMHVAVCNLPQQAAVGAARFKMSLLNPHHLLGNPRWCELSVWVCVQTRGKFVHHQAPEI